MGIGFAFKDKNPVPAKPAVVLEERVPEKTVASPVPTQVFELYVENPYQKAGLAQKGLPLNVFHKAVVGYYDMMAASFLSEEKPLITVVDFN